VRPGSIAKKNDQPLSDIAMPALSTIALKSKSKSKGDLDLDLDSGMESHPDLKLYCSFLWFYDLHYCNGQNLPKYIDPSLFREHMLTAFTITYQDSIDNDQPDPLGPSLLYPVMTGCIDPVSDNYDTYWTDKYQVEAPVLVLSLQEEWFGLVRSGKKTAELRKGKEGQYDDLKCKLIVLSLNGDKTGEHSIMVRVTDVEYMRNLDDLCCEGRGDCVVPQTCNNLTAQEAKDRLLGIHKRNGTQVFSQESINKKGGLCVIHFNVVYVNSKTT
jgi:hypothetical protein